MKKFQLAYLETGKKLCSNCNIEKSNSEFFKRKEKGILKLRSHCKECIALKKQGVISEESKNEYRENKKRKTEEYRRIANFNRKDKILDTTYRSKYGITLEIVEEMKKKQDYKCYICQKQTKLVVDHCHKTEKVRKLLCDNCNKSLGLMKENKEAIEKMKNYIEEHETCGVCEVYCGNSWCTTNTKEEQ